MNTRTLLIDLNKLNRDKEVAALLIRLMMACNDLSLANSCLSKYKRDTGKHKKYVNIGASMYFVRLQIGHLHEGLKIIKDLKRNKTFRDKIRICSQNAKSSFHYLCRLIAGGVDKDKFDKYFKPIRHNLIFHYHESGTWINRALNERIQIKGQKLSKVTFGHVERMRFELADEIIDSIVCRNLFDIPYDVDFQKDRSQVDEILDFGFSIYKNLLVVFSELIYKFSEDYSAV